VLIEDSFWPVKACAGKFATFSSHASRKLARNDDGFLFLAEDDVTRVRHNQEETKRYAHQYFLYLYTEKHVARSTATVSLSAFKFLYEYTLVSPGRSSISSAPVWHKHCQ
jgi:hypothetical protein